MRQFLEKITELQKSNYCHYQICSGHDVIFIFSLFIKNLCVNEQSQNKKISHEDIEKSLRNAVRQGDFEHKKLYKEVSDFIANVVHTSSNQSV